jgi:mono/diheme cytochrome c family protein
MKLILSILLLSSLLFSNDEQFDIGKKVYEETCISCHGINGETNPAMKLAVKPRKLNMTILEPSQSAKIIAQGAHYWGARADIMPAWKYIYSQEQIEAVALYISKAFNPTRDEKIKKLMDESTSVAKISDEKMLKIGAKIFKRNCSLCHGKTGNGESDYVEKSKASNVFIYPYNLTRTLLTQDQIFLYAKFGGHYWGTDKSDMPSWKKKYDDVKLKSVAKYITEKIIKID